MDSILTRFLWQVGLPTGSSFAAWGAVLLSYPHGSPGTPYMISAVLPLVGLVGAGRYRALADGRVLVAPYVPYALAAAGYAVSMIMLGRDVNRDPDGAFIPVYEGAIGFMLPFIALVCGLTSFVMTGPRR